MDRISFALILIVAVGIAACDTAQPDTPLAPEDLPTALAPTATDPASHGAIITLDETVPFFAHFDAKRGLMSVHGGLVELCQGDPFTTVARMIVETPSEIEQTLFKFGEEEQPVVIYRTSTGAVTCGLVLSEEARVASGMVRHDQVFTLASFKATWRGDVTAPDGSSHHLTEVYQLSADIHDPNNPATWSLNASQILIQ